MIKQQSKIEKLIFELCPNGVPLVSLGELTSEQANRNSTQSINEVRSVTNKRGLVKTSDFFDNTRTSQNTSNYKIVEPGMIVYNPSRINVGSIARNKESIPVIVSPMYIVVSIDTQKIHPEYLDIFLSSTQGKSQILNNVEVGARFRFTYESFSKIRLFLPPIEIQKTIVKILNSFIDLENELEAELEARELQYRHYRNQLLSMDGDEVQWKTLGEVAEYRRGSFPQPYGENRWYGGEGAMPFVQVADVGESMRLVENTKQKISKLAQPKSVFVPTGTVIVTLQGSIGRVAVTQYDSYVDRTLAIFESYKIKINKKYFAYQLESKFSIEKENARGSTIKTITKEEFTKFKIPVPPLETQDRIVSTLDAFNLLLNDISVGLPAEIKARRSQYEYYTRKLLTFNKYAN